MTTAPSGCGQRGGDHVRHDGEGHRHPVAEHVGELEPLGGPHEGDAVAEDLAVHPPARPFLVVAHPAIHGGIGGIRDREADDGRACGAGRLAMFRAAVPKNSFAFDADWVMLFRQSTTTSRAGNCAARARRGYASTQRNPSRSEAIETSEPIVPSAPATGVSSLHSFIARPIDSTRSPLP